jgi:membrane fusion protein (multidrug efflux system)
MVRVSQMATRQNLMLSALLAALFLAGGCGENKSESVAAAPPTTPLAPSSTPVERLTPTPSKADETLTVSSPLIVEHQVDVTAQRDGVVAKILFDAPTRVRERTVLARLDDRQISANLEAARAKSRSIADDLKNWEAEAEVLKADYARAKRLWDLGLITQEQLQHAQYKAESDQWDIKRVSEMLVEAHEEERSLELELEKTKITAPFDGLIARRYVREGQSITKGERLFWVTAERPLRLRFTLPERFLGHLKRGQELSLTSPDVPLEKHAVKIMEISPVVDPSSGTIEILAELVGKAGNLHPGMTASVRVDYPR